MCAEANAYGFFYGNVAGQKTRERQGKANVPGEKTLTGETSGMYGIVLIVLYFQAFRYLQVGPERCSSALAFSAAQ